MKKLVALMLFFCLAITGAFAQTEYKAKPTSSPTQKVHNVFSKHKRHNGYKIKSKRHGHKRKKVVKYHHGHTEVKTTGMLTRKQELNAA